MVAGSNPGGRGRGSRGNVDVEERGVRVHVRKAHIVEMAPPERADHLVQPNRDRGHLRP